MSMYIEDGDGVCSAMTEGGGGLAGTTTALDAVDSLFTCCMECVVVENQPGTALS